MTVGARASGRTVIVTGGSRGIGAALVDSFLAAGDRVATCSRKETAAVSRWSTADDRGDRFYFEPLDIAAPERFDVFLEHVIRKFGTVDILVNNAGVAREGVLGLMRDADIDTVIDLNLKATLRVTRAVVRRMLLQGSGRIINISSVVGLSGYRGLSVYSATKAGLDAITRALARELGSRGITVNSVAPGYLETELSGELSDAQLQQIVRRTPLGRLAEPSDVVSAVRFLTSSEAAFVTGQVLVVDGGLTT